MKSATIITEAHRPAPIATLRNVLRHIQRNGAWTLCHAGIMAEGGKC